MEENKNILESVELRQNPYSVPEGYFENLRPRLHVVTEERTAAPSVWTRFMPYAALAASFAIIVAVGTAILRPTTAVSPEQASFDYALLAPRTNPYSVYDAAALDEDEEGYNYGEYTNDDIVQFLIESGISVENIAYTAYYETNR